MFARFKPGKEPIVTIEPGMKIIPMNSQIGDLSMIEFFGSVGTTTARTKILPEGNYKLCLGLQEVAPTGTTVGFNGEDCGTFFMAQMKRTTIISPQANATIDPQAVQQFVWTPVDHSVTNWRPQYTLIIVPVYPGQDPRGAFTSNAPIFERSVVSTDITLFPSDFSLLTTTKGIAARVDITDPSGFSLEGEVSAYTVSVPATGLVSDSDCVEIRKEYESISQKLEKQKNDCDDLRKKLADLEAELANAESDLTDATAKAADAQTALDGAQAEADKTQKDLDKAIKNLQNMLPKGFSVDVYSGKFSDRPNAQSNAIGRGGSSGGFPNAGGVAVQWGGAGSGQGGANHLIGLGQAFFDAFRAANAAYQANATAQKNLADAKAKKESADKEVSDLKNKINDLQSQIDALKNQLADCEKETEKITEERIKIVELEEDCLKRLDEQRTAEEKIRDAEEAIGEAEGSKSEAEKSIGQAENAIGEKPNTDGEKRDTDNAKEDVEQGDSSLSDAERLLEEARQAYAEGNTTKAQDLADSAKKEAEKAEDQYDDANRSADYATRSADPKPTQEQIDQQKAEEEQRRKEEEERRLQHEAELEAEQLAKDALATELAGLGIPPELAPCFVDNKKALADFLKWIRDNKPKNVNLEAFESIGDALERVGELASEITEALAKGASLAEGIAKGLASAGFGLLADLYYDAMKEAMEKKVKEITDKHVLGLLSAHQFKGTHGVIKGKGIHKESATSYFYMKDCKTGKYHIFRISATFGFEYMGVTDNR